MGWKCRYANESIKSWNKRRNRGRKSGPGWKYSYKITYKSGEIIIAKSLRQFALEHKYSLGNLHRINHGQHPYGISKIERIEDANNNLW